LDPEQLGATLLLTFSVLVYGLLLGAHGVLYSFTGEDLDRVLAEGGRRAKLLRVMLQTPRQTSLSLILMRRLVLVGAVLAGTWAWLAWTGRVSPWAVLIGLPPVAIFIGSFLSQSILRAPARYCHRLALPLWLFYRLAHPLHRSLRHLTERILSTLSIPLPARDEDVIEREYLGLLEVGHREGVVESGEHRLIHRVFEFAERPVSKVMTPRTDMVMLPVETELTKVVFRLRKTGYSRIPVYRRRRDEIVGILYAKDLLRLQLPNGHEKPQSLEDLLQEPYYVPTHMSIDELLKEFQRRKLHLAVCVDEYGGIAGLVTMEDLLEELFGEIYDEFDLQIRKWEQVGEGHYLVSGRMEIDELQELLQMSIDEPDCHTVAGLILKLFGRLPRRGEIVERNGLRFTVDKVVGTRVQAVRIEKFVEGKEQ
jgi:putative hemolysin